MFSNFRSLNFLLPFSLIVMVTIVVLSTMINGLYKSEAKLNKTAIEDIKQEVSILTRISERLLLVDRQILEDFITQVATDTRVSIGIIADNTGTIIYATDFSKRGKSAFETIPYLDRTLFDKAVGRRTAILEQYSSGNIITATMSFTQLDVKETIRSTKKGIVYLVFDISEEKQRAFQEEVVENIIEISFLLMIGFFYAWLLNKFIARPLSRLQNATNAIVTGEFRENLLLSGPDEIRDVTEAFNIMAKQLKINIATLESQRQKSETIVNNILDGVVTIKSDGEITSFNQAAEKIFLHSKESIIGSNIKILFAGQYKNRLSFEPKQNPDVKEFLPIGQIHELSAIRKTGEIFPVEVGINEIRIDDQSAFIVVIRDVTEQRKIEQLKNEFISTVSHELRTPLTAINGAIGLVVAGAGGGVSEKASGILQLAKRNCDRLLDLINDLLDMEKILAGKMQFNFDSYDIRELVEDAVNVNLTYAKKFQVSLMVRGEREPLLVRVDNKRLEQVFSNFISNACKFSRPGSVVDIEIQRHQNRVRINVIDSGTGISEEFKKSIFQKFSQEDSGNKRKVGGTGLGLAISKAIVENMNGMIGFDSKEGVGSTFFVEFPVMDNC